MFDSHAGYAIASKIDKLLNGALQDHEITEPDNRSGYEALIRTIRTSTLTMRRKLRYENYNVGEKAAYDAGVQAGRDEMEIVGTP